MCLSNYRLMGKPRSPMLLSMVCKPEALTTLAINAESQATIQTY